MKNTAWFPLTEASKAKLREQRVEGGSNSWEEVDMESVCSMVMKF